jgi:hypothetical protein
VRCWAILCQKDVATHFNAQATGRFVETCTRRLAERGGFSRCATSGSSSHPRPTESRPNAGVRRTVCSAETIKSPSASFNPHDTPISHACNTTMRRTCTTMDFLKSILTPKMIDAIELETLHWAQGDFLDFADIAFG